jgi:hypothetical protein
MTRDENSHYTILLQDGKAWQFYFPPDVKSVITRPSPGLVMKGPGFHEISAISRLLSGQPSDLTRWLVPRSALRRPWRGGRRAARRL